MSQRLSLVGLGIVVLLGAASFAGKTMAAPVGIQGLAPFAAPTATPVPVAYVTSYYVANSAYQTRVASFNTATNKFTGTIATTPGVPEGASLSGDGKELYISFPITVGNSKAPGSLVGFAVSPTSAKMNANATYTAGDYGLAYAGITTGTSPTADVFIDTNTSSAFDITTIALKTTKVGPGLSSPVQDAVVAPGTGVQNSYVLDAAGNFRTYTPSSNAYSRAITGISNGLGLGGVRSVTVQPNGAQVFALGVKQTGQYTGTSTVYTINPNSLSVTRTSTIPYLCYEITADTLSAHVYTMCESIANNVPTFHVAQILTSNGSVKIATVPDTTIRAAPSLAITPDSKNMLLTAGSGSTSGFLDVVSVATDSLVARVALPTAGTALVQASEVFTTP